MLYNTHLSHDQLLHSPALARPLPSGTRSYRTDALGRRVQILHNGAVESTLLYSTGLLPIAKLDAQQQLAQLYLYAERANSPSVILQRTAHGFTPYRVITDHLGSPRLIVNAQTGDVAQQLDYDVWGQVLHDTQPGFQPFGFAGGLYDPQTGLVRFGARDYDPYAGRWLAKDPIGFGGGDGNLYAYVGNDPVNWIDPDGQLPSLPDWAVDFSAGFGDALTLNITRWYRNHHTSFGDLVNECSDAYGLGVVSGILVQTALFTPSKVVTVARTAEQAADVAYLAGKMSGAAAELRVGDRVFTGVSGEIVPLSPEVTGALMGTPKAQRAAWHGGCAEIACLDKAFNAGVNPVGGSIRAVNIGVSGAGHNTPKIICSSCNDVLSFFKVNH